MIDGIILSMQFDNSTWTREMITWLENLTNC